MKSLAVLLVCLWSSFVYAKTVYVDPNSTLEIEDGTLSAPWKSFYQVIKKNTMATYYWDTLPYKEGVSVLRLNNAKAPIKGGDTIFLMNGDYGRLVIKNVISSIFFCNTKIWNKIIKILVIVHIVVDYIIIYPPSFSIL